MKKVLVLLLAFVMVMSLAACGNGGSGSSQVPANNAASSNGNNEASPDDVEWVRNVELQVPAAAGGGTDVAARALASYISQESGSNLTIVNNSDGGGVVAFETTRNAKTDGSLIMHFHTTMLIKTASGVYDKYAADDFTVIAVGQSTEKGGYVLLVTADYEAQTLDEFVQLAKDKPGELLIGIETGGSSHVMAGLFAKAAGDLDMRYVEAGADTEKLTALMGGSIDACLVNPNQANQYLEAGRATALAQISTDGSGERGTVLPDVPTFNELGVDFSYGTNHFILGPKGMDEALARKIHAYYAAAAEDPGVNEILIPAGLEMRIVPFEDGPAVVRAQQEALDAVVADLGI